MTEANAVELIRLAITTFGGVWADLGAGTGTFTMALAKLIGGGGTIHAVERDANAVRQLAQNAHALRSGDANYASVVGVCADFTLSLELPPLNGVLIANALHFVPYPQQVSLLQVLSKRLLPEGRIVLVEYDRVRGHQYNPFPISAAMLPKLATEAGLGQAVYHARTPSAFGGDLYCASVSAVE